MPLPGKKAKVIYRSRCYVAAQTRKEDITVRQNLKTKYVLLFLALSWSTSALLGQTILTADGTTAAYTQVQNALGAPPETPDCSHPAFGPHITEAMDTSLGKSVFVFHMHVTPDNDRCVNFDRQRLEIKTDGSSPDALKGFLNDSVTYRWKFKLDAGFQPSSNFTHIHQIKAGDGDSGAPIITLTPRKGSPNIIQLIHSTGSSGGTSLGVVTSTALAPFLGTWVEAVERVTYSHTGSYSIVLTRISDGATLLTYSNNNIDLWRVGTTFSRPKWGIYRSLLSQADLRDEDVRFDRFCIAKAPADCVSDQRTCVTPPTDGAWHNTAFSPAKTGTFTATFDATPSISPISAAVGLSHGTQAAFSGFANLAIFTTSGTIQARNGSAYAAASTIPSAAGVTYHFRLAVNVPAHTYSIFVTPSGGTELTVGSNFAFRAEQNTVTSLDHWGVLANTSPGGSLAVCNFSVQ